MIRFLGTRNCLIFWRREIRQPWILEMYTHTPRHALCEKRRAVTSPWVGSRAISLRALTLALVWLLFAVTVQRRPLIFPLDDIPPTLYGLHHQGQSPSATRVIVGMKTACKQPQVFPLILVSPDGKGQELSPPPTSQPEKQTQNQPLLSTQLLRGLLLLSHFQAKSPVSQRPRRGSWRQCPVNPLRRDNTVSLL